MVVYPAQHFVILAPEQYKVKVVAEDERSVRAIDQDIYILSGWKSMQSLRMEYRLTT